MDVGFLDFVFLGHFFQIKTLVESTEGPQGTIYKPMSCLDIVLIGSDLYLFYDKWSDMYTTGNIKNL